MKTLIIPDLHTKFEKAQRILEKYDKTHKFIFMGDYFDQFGDTPELNAYTAHWLINTMNAYEDAIFLKGNHDEVYDPRVNVMCSGFSTQKKKAINEVMKIEDWNRLKYFHHELGWWFSHAGLSVNWHINPMHDTITENTLQSIIDNAIIQQRADNNTNAIWASSYARGGNCSVGGLLWEDWYDLKLIDDLNQIVGHTPVKTIKVIQNNISININVDTSARGSYFHQLLELDENGKYSIINTSNL